MIQNTIVCVAVKVVYLLLVIGWWSLEVCFPCFIVGGLKTLFQELS